MAVVGKPLAGMAVVDKPVVGIPGTSTCMGMADTCLAAVERSVAQKLAAVARRSVVDVAKTLAAAVRCTVVVVAQKPAAAGAAVQKLAAAVRCSVAQTLVV
jgi:hypothetical protein